MRTPQGGIFALGTASHAYLEFDVSAGVSDMTSCRDCVAARTANDDGRRQPRGRLPARALASGSARRHPADLAGFESDLVGSDGFVMPATQHDAVLWLSGSAYDVIFDVARARSASWRASPSLVDETSSWPYQHDRDLTGFIDGSENPTLIDAPEFALVPDGQPGAGGSILLLQKWEHEAAAWESLPVAEQEQVIGRTKPDSIELEDKPAELPRREHRPGHLRQDLPAEHALRNGCRARNDVRRLLRDPATARCHAQEHGRADRRHPRRAHALHAPLTGAYYFVPSTESLRLAAGAADAQS